MKRSIRYLLLLLLILVQVSCDQRQQENRPHKNDLTANVVENHSYANTDRIRTHHLHLDLDINFENRTIYGVARHEMINSGTDTAVFDIKNIEIQKITTGIKGRETETDFVIGSWDKDSILGQPLMVKIRPSTTRINIYYKTTDRSEALDWLSAEMTSGKKYPFLYTQGEAILTRSWIPIQDMPSNRLTFSASVHVPEGILPLMSARNPQKRASDNTYQFEMEQPIPSYLIALAAGNLSYQKLGSHCGVYAEPELLRACAHEFTDLPKMIRAAEKLYGKYQWKQYDLIVLPYSFPFGGMENPRLTFVNPTILAGDRSLVTLVAHELAHSWSGNLVTNRTWDDFWLNEGFTVYFEHRIMESLYGKEIADILAKIEYQELKEELIRIKESKHPEDTKLKLKLKDRNPDDGMSDVAYTKGAFFLKTLERDLGRQRLDQFLRSYFKKYSFKSVDSEQFLSYLKLHLLQPNHLVFNAEEWIYGEGLPKNCYVVRSPRMDQIKHLAKRFTAGENIFYETKWIKIKGKKKRKKQVIKLDRNKYITQEWQAFIRELPETIDTNRMIKLDKELNFKGWGNSEIMCEWYVLGIRSGYRQLRPFIEQFVTKIGRRKFLVPIFEALKENPEDYRWAKRVFERAKNQYHFVSRSSIESILFNK